MKNLLTRFHFFSKSNQTRSPWRRDPSHDWIVLLASALIIFVAILIWNAWTFETVANGGVIGTPPTGKAPIFNQSSLDTIHIIFDTRAAEDAKYLSDTYHFADPSQ